VAVSRYLSTAEIALYGVLTATITMGIVIVPFTTYIGRVIPESTTRATPAVSAALIMQGTTALVLLGSLLTPMPVRLLRGLSGVQVTRVDAVLTSAIIASGILQALGRQWIQADYRYTAATILNVLSSTAWIGIFLPIALAGHASVSALLLTILLASTVTAFVACRTVTWPRSRGDMPSFGQYAEVCRYSVPLIMVAASVSIFGVGDRIILSHSVSPESLAKYTFMYILYGLALSGVGRLGRSKTETCCHDRRCSE